MDVVIGDLFTISPINTFSTLGFLNSLKIATSMFYSIYS